MVLFDFIIHIYFRKKAAGDQPDNFEIFHVINTESMFFLSLQKNKIFRKVKT